VGAISHHNPSSSRDLRFRSVAGLGRQVPLAAASLVLAHFSLAGLPLLGSFPAYIALWTSLARQSQPYAFFAVVGSACLAIAGLRHVGGSIISDDNQPWKVPERGLQPVLLVMGVILLFVVGLIPGWLFPYITQLGQVFNSPLR